MDRTNDPVEISVGDFFEKLSPNNSSHLSLPNFNN